MSETMHYNKHVFFCTNQKDNGKQCCAEGDALAMWAYARERCKEAGLTAHDNVRISKSGCLGRCAEGPCLVVYPQGRWYRYETKADIDAIVDEDLTEGEIVTRLRIDAPRTV
jgi:(2Fe-2S) ferredoxin